MHTDLPLYVLKLDVLLFADNDNLRRQESLLPVLTHTEELADIPLPQATDYSHIPDLNHRACLIFFKGSFSVPFLDLGPKKVLRHQHVSNT